MLKNVSNYHKTKFTNYCNLYRVKLNTYLIQQQQPFNGRLSGTTRVGRYQKKHSPAHTHPGQRTSFITFLHLQRSSPRHPLFQLTCLTVLSNNLFPGLLWSSPWSWTLDFILHAFLHPVISSFRSTCPYQHSLFCCNINAISSTPLWDPYLGVCLLA